MNLKRIGKYEIKGEIGRGTMGTVYKAWDPVLKRHVAIKTMPATPGHNDESKARFQREAQAAALLAHPNIVTVHDLGEEQGLVFMAMELLEGQDLRDVISEDASGRQVQTLDEKIGVMEQVAAGLAFAHSKRVVHRDLKPANIHIQPNGHVKIVDFGLARLGGSDMTQDGIVLGTPNYMSPEQAMGDKVDERTDVFSAGGVFYELLTDRKPFDAETTPGVLYQVVHKEPVPIAKWLPDLPRIVVEVVERCLAKDKKRRFQNGRQLRAALGMVRQAVAAGRGDASLAEESQRANEDVRKSDSSHRGGLSPAGSKPPWIDGTAALDPVSERPSLGSPRTAPTLSGRAPTQSGRPSRGGWATPRAILPALGLLVLVVLVEGYWYQVSIRREAPPPPAPSPTDASRDQMGALTDALVESQIELAVKNLDDKNWTEAITQAERALKLRPESGRARQILEQAKRKSAELAAEAARARQAYEAGNEQEASQALDRVLELDPKHPVATELNAKLNAAFRSRAQEAKGLSQRARVEAEKAKAAGQEGFAQAVAQAVDGETHFKRSEFADATQRYLEARDSFDRARRTAALATAKPTPGPAAPAPTADTRASSGPGGGPVPAASSPSPGTASPATSIPLRTFVTGQSAVASSRSGGGLAGFDSADVKTKKMPDLVGRLEFEVEPGTPRAGEEFTVRVYLVNEGKKAVHLRGLALTVTADGKRSSLGATMREHDVTTQMRALVAEGRASWPTSVTSWSLEAVASSDRDETCTARLTWQ